MHVCVQAPPPKWSSCHVLVEHWAMTLYEPAADDEVPPLNTSNTLPLP